MNKQLEKILKSSYSNCEYYREIYKKNNWSIEDLLKEENFNKIPILTRETIVNEFENILHDDYKYLKRKQLHLIQTSGSSGNFVDVLWHPEEFLDSNLSLWRRRRLWYGITPLHRKCTFSSGTTVGVTITGNNEDLIIKKDRSIELSVINMSAATLEKYYRVLCDFEPEWIYAPPSALVVFVEYCRERGSTNFPKLKYVELATEQVMESTYRYIKEFFNVPVAIMYGSKEVNGIALQNPRNGKLEVIEDNVFLEQTEDNRVLVTSLKNSIFPIIRYELGDTIELSKVDFNSGESSIYINNIRGRTRTLSYVTKDGITTAAIVNCIFVVNARLNDPFIQYKIIETATGLTICLVLKKAFCNWKAVSGEELMACMKSYDIPSSSIEIVFSDKALPPDGKTGKIRLFEKGL